MAIDQGTETLAIKTQERTWRLTIETPKGGQYVATAYREVVRTTPDGTVISKEPSGMTSRVLSDVQAEVQPFTPAAAGWISGAELAGLLAARADAWRQADLEAEAARLAEERARMAAAADQQAG